MPKGQCVCGTVMLCWDKKIHNAVSSDVRFVHAQQGENLQKCYLARITAMCKAQVLKSFVIFFEATKVLFDLKIFSL